MASPGRLGWQRRILRTLSSLVLGALLGSCPSAAGAICGDGNIYVESFCPCDCDGSGNVTVDEILTAISIALGATPVSNCYAADLDGNETTTVDEIVVCINGALNGCFPGGGLGGEECDDGGRCVGGANAGTFCVSEDECVGDGACFGGVNDLRGCASDDDCGDAPCRKCRPYGGDSCAANCTFETDQACPLVSLNTGGPIGIAGSNAVIASPFIPLPLPPLPLEGSQILTTGNLVHGSATVAIKAAGVDFAPIAISTIACACARGVEARSCGGTIFDRDGAASLNCTPGFVGEETCPPDKACAAIHGPGNAGSGFIACGDAGVDTDVIRDCNGTPGGQPSDPEVTISRRSGSLPADRGSGQLIITSAIGTVVGLCTGSSADYGPDGLFCNADDPVSSRGTPNTIVFTTNTASGTVLNPGNFQGDVLGPVRTSGEPFTCNDGTTVGVSGTNLAGAFTSCDQPTVADIAVSVNFVCE